MFGLVAGVLAGGLAFAQDDEDQAPPQAPWCQSAAPEASADSLALSLIFVPSEYAQVKSRVLLQGTSYVPVDKTLAADLGVPDEFVQPNTYLVRAGGYFQPQGRPDRNVQAWWDPDNGLLQINTYADTHSTTPSNWAAVVVAPGPVNDVRSICLPNGG
jgi:hypothetical protein